MHGVLQREDKGRRGTYWKMVTKSQEIYGLLNLWEMTGLLSVIIFSYLSKLYPLQSFTLQAKGQTPFKCMLVLPPNAAQILSILKHALAGSDL